MTAAKAPAKDGLTPAERRVLADIGRQVRERLDADPGVHRVGVEGVDLYAVSGFLSGPECERLIGLIDAVAQPSPTYPGGALHRTSWSGDFDPGDPFVKMIERRIADLIGIEETWAETMQGQRYHVGQEFLPHFDWFQPEGVYWPEERQRAGQRSWTAMVYLNTVEQGGETDFPKIGASVPPQPGVLIAWNNARADGRTNPLTLHAAKPVLAGSKYVITKWFRCRRWQ